MSPSVFTYSSKLVVRLEPELVGDLNHVEFENYKFQAFRDLFQFPYSMMTISGNPKLLTAKETQVVWVSVV